MCSITVPNLTRFIREDISLIKKREEGERGKIWYINPLLAVTHKTDFFNYLLYCYNQPYIFQN